MNLRRIYAIIIRHYFNVRKSLGRLANLFYWPFMSLVMWGITSKFLLQQSVNKPSFLTVILSGVVFWIIVSRAQNSITVNLLEEIWNHNLGNLFVTPLKFSEWLAALIITSILEAIISFIFAAIISFALYQAGIFIYGFHILPFVFLLFLFGWTVGLFISALILLFGARLQTLAWTALQMAAPFSLIYYPREALPGLAQKISYLVPTSYVFEGMREIVLSQTLTYSKLLTSSIIGIVYFLISILFIFLSYQYILKKQGLADLY